MRLEDLCLIRWAWSVSRSSKDLSYAGKKTRSTRSSNTTHRNHRNLHIGLFRPSGGSPGLSVRSDHGYYEMFPSVLRSSARNSHAVFPPRSQVWCPSGGLSGVLEDDASLEAVCLDVRFENPALSRSKYQNQIEGLIRPLMVPCRDLMDAVTLIYCIVIPRCTRLGIGSDNNMGLILTILSCGALTHLPNLSSPTFMERLNNVGNIGI